MPPRGALLLAAAAAWAPPRLLDGPLLGGLETLSPEEQELLGDGLRRHRFGSGLFAAASAEFHSTSPVFAECAPESPFCAWDARVRDAVAQLLGPGAPPALDEILARCLAPGAAAWVLGAIHSERVCLEVLLWVSHWLPLPVEMCPFFADLAFRPTLYKTEALWNAAGAGPPPLGPGEVGFLLGAPWQANLLGSLGAGVLHVFEPIPAFVAPSLWSAEYSAACTFPAQEQLICCIEEVRFAASQNMAGHVGTVLLRTEAIESCALHYATLFRENTAAPYTTLPYGSRL